MITSGPHHRAPAVGHRHTRRATQTPGQPSPRRNLIHRFGEGLSAALLLATQPATFPPPKLDLPAATARSLGPVVTHPLTRLAGTPHPGHDRAR